jgi:hypothetical protein
VTSENRVVATDAARIAGVFALDQTGEYVAGPCLDRDGYAKLASSDIASAHWTVCDALCARSSSTAVLRDTARVAAQRRRTAAHDRADTP